MASAASGSGHRATALDFATKTVFGDPVTSEEKSEVVETLRELVTYFGAPAILRAVAELDIAKAAPGHASEQVLQALRAYTVLILESDRPMLTATLVGKLAKLEMTTGKRIILRELGRAEGISKQAVSKRMALYAQRLNLPRPDSTPEARESHRQMNRRNYAPAPPSVAAG